MRCESCGKTRILGRAKSDNRTLTEGQLDMMYILILSGVSVRKIALAVGCNKNSVQNHRACAIGRFLEHRSID